MAIFNDIDDLDVAVAFQLEEYQTELRCELTYVHCIGAAPVNILNSKLLSNRFPDIRIPNVLLPPLKIMIFGPKTTKFGHFEPKI